MDVEKNILWKKILGEIEIEVSEGKFITLFKPTSLLSFEKNIATVACPSTMIIDLLRKRYYQTIKKTLDKHTGVDSKIVFVPKVVVRKEKYFESPLFQEAEKKDIVPQKLARVNPDYTFQTMAVSSTNQLAYVSATTVAEKIGRSYNPLFIYGPVGVGKTHLMQAIANKVYQKDPSAKIIYITSEEFTNEVVAAIRENDTARMKKRFRSVSLLIIDDVQFFAGKEKIQEEIFHTFNILADEGAQMVLSSDRPPSEIKKLEKRLTSRFAGGLTVDIAPPDFELRCAILLIKAKKHGIDLSIDIAKKIAEKTQDTRTLEGYLLRVITQAKTKGVDVTPTLADEALRNNAQEQKRPRHPDDLIKNVCNFYDIKPLQIKSAKRSSYLVRARQICMYLLKNELGLTFVEIGNLLGGRDHTTIMYGVEKIREQFLKKKDNGEIMGVTSYLNEHNPDY